MPRKKRKKSHTGIYHVILRSVNQQDIFEDGQDYEKFLEKLIAGMITDDFQILAYCIMRNHVHLLIQTNTVPLGVLVQRLVGTFAVWYNKKYKRSGHLFQDRYKSIPCENTQYLITAWRYILQNPLKAGLENVPGESFHWSSIDAYLGIPDNITDTSMIDQCFENEKAMRDFLFEYGKYDGNRMNIMTRDCLTDEDALVLMYDLCGCGNTTEFQRLARDSRNFYIRELYELPTTEYLRMWFLC